MTQPVRQNINQNMDSKAPQISDPNVLQVIDQDSVVLERNSRPTFDEDDFDLIEHKKAASTETKAKAFKKRAHRNVAVGRIIVFVIALIVCVALYFMALNLTAIF